MFFLHGNDLQADRLEPSERKTQKMQGEIQITGQSDNWQNSSGLPITREGRAFNRALRMQDMGAVLQARQLQNSAQIAQLAMEAVREVNTHRRLLTQGDEQTALAMALADVAVNHLAVVLRIQRG